MDLAAEQRLARHLLRGERILWAGRPKQGLLLGAMDLLVIPFGLVFLSVGIATVAATYDRPFSFGSIGPVLAIAAGSFLAVGRPILDALLRARTWYAITEKRILILREGLFPSMISLDRALLGQVELLETGARGTPRGTIRFGPAQASGHNSRGPIVPSLDPTPQFLAIANPAEVFALLQRTRPGERAA